jgi:hypothetical protein
MKTSKLAAIYQSTERDVTEDLNLQQRRCENLKPRIIKIVLMLYYLFADIHPACRTQLEMTRLYHVTKKH